VFTLECPTQTAIASVFACRDLRRQHLVCRFHIYQGVDIELSRDDIGPLIQDAVEYLVALYIENGNGPTSDPSINVLTGSVGPKFVSIGVQI
jgi:hypothetical protein